MTRKTRARPPLDLFLAAPRGTCAGVERAVRAVELAIERFGPPVYVRHEIVHNRFVVERLRAMGAVFVAEVDAVPRGSVVVFSAHGVPQATRDAASARELRVVDATCPLVAKVHHAVRRHHRAGRAVVLVGHAGHVEVEGTLGQLPDGAIALVESEAEAEALDVAGSQEVAYVAQTTLAVDEVERIAAALRSRFPAATGPAGGDVCYATTNRQAAIRMIADRVEKLLVVGSANSSNSRRLVEVAQRSGCADSRLVEDAASLDWAWLGTPKSLGLSAGASAPEQLVEQVVDALHRRFAIRLHGATAADENLTFRLPAGLEPGCRERAEE